MANLAKLVLLILLPLALVSNSEAASPFFLQAIASALGTIPFTTGPVSGLVGAKLAVGSKLLYYLGFFGRRRSANKPKPRPAPPAPAKQRFSGGGGTQFSGGMQAVPLPYAFGAGSQQFGGFPQQFGGGFGGGNPNVFAQYPYGYDPAQLFQMLAAQGMDPTSIMQAMSMGGGGGGQAMLAAQGMNPTSAMQAMSMGGGGQAVPASQFPFPTGGNPAFSMPATSSLERNPQKDPSERSSETDSSSPSDGVSDSEVESFFTFLRDMDDNTCISRLMCDIGSNPSFLGEFSENINGIISTLDVVPSSGAFEYISIMERGRSEGGCDKKFPQCNDAAYEIVKNVAPSVGMPSNINL